MENSTQLTDTDGHRCQHHHRHRYPHNRHCDRTFAGEFGEDNCSTDSGCSSGGSIGSGEHLSHRDDGKRLCRSSKSSRSHCYLGWLRERSTRSQERVSNAKSSPSRSCSPKAVRSLSRGGASPLYSSSPSDAYSSSDSDSLETSSTTEILRRVFRSLKVTPSKGDNQEKKYVKKSPKRILRSPVSYMYVRGLSGLPTQRVPRKAVQQQTIQPTQDLLDCVDTSSRIYRQNRANLDHMVEPKYSYKGNSC